MEQGEFAKHAGAPLRSSGNRLSGPKLGPSPSQTEAIDSNGRGRPLKVEHRLGVIRETLEDEIKFLNEATGQSDAARIRTG